MNPPAIDSHFNRKRGETTHRIKKAGTSAFLLFNNDELRELRDLIDSALGGTTNDSTD
ncbi:hypothetical protein JOJ86_003427 [Rhodococcus percolatus]|uniref:hypothetical protein n=1 Tax=Rhodococcus opacus TaxID=37919 RepID=UPI0015FA80AF|nr:hypothetical protein [Rhodococcus opacus]MBA8960136.1 hypothetical protein [Rhodococcus opacus]MBP2205701.1 hypothetical protein [Rhodococcus opacus]